MRPNNLFWFFLKNKLIQFYPIYIFRGIGASLILASILLSSSGILNDEYIIYLNNITIIGSVISLLMTFEIGKIVFYYSNSGKKKPKINRAPSVFYLLILLIIFLVGNYLRISFEMLFLGFVYAIILSLFNFIVAELSFKPTYKIDSKMLISLPIFLLSFSFLILLIDESFMAILIIYFFIQSMTIFLNKKHLARFLNMMRSFDFYFFKKEILEKFLFLFLITLLIVLIIQFPRILINNSGLHNMFLSLSFVMFLSQGIESYVFSRILEKYMAVKRLSSEFDISNVEILSIFLFPLINTLLVFLLFKIFWMDQNWMASYFFIVFALEFFRILVTTSANGLGLFKSKMRMNLLLISLILSILFSYLYLSNNQEILSSINTGF